MAATNPGSQRTPNGSHCGGALLSQSSGESFRQWRPAPASGQIRSWPIHHGAATAEGGQCRRAGAEGLPYYCMKYQCNFAHGARLSEQ